MFHLVTDQPATLLVGSRPLGGHSLGPKRTSQSPSYDLHAQQCLPLFPPRNCRRLRRAQAYGPGLWPRPMACSFWLATCMHYSACCYLPPAAAGGLAPRLVRLMDFALAGYAHALRCPCLRTRLPRVSSVCLDEHTYVRLHSAHAHAHVLAHVQGMYPPDSRLRQAAYCHPPPLGRLDLSGQAVGPFVLGVDFHDFY